MAMSAVFSFLSIPVIPAWLHFPNKTVDLSSPGSRDFRLMAKPKRITITLECTGCVQGGFKVNKEARGVSRYTTEKNRLNKTGCGLADALKLKKYCPYCHKHTIHGEIKHQKKKRRSKK
ncbi:hypothetical protein V6N11_036119 [Hibiscus sabdariffa]|uniref:50S ribosomal protein L33, chloroplastic n=1 Tax=Hibiscus sabdariffa TaxID=183260 RepID=A0ABR2R9F9_9ROSI